MARLFSGIRRLLARLALDHLHVATGFVVLVEVGVPLIISLLVLAFLLVTAIRRDNHVRIGYHSVRTISLVAPLILSTVVNLPLIFATVYMASTIDFVVFGVALVGMNAAQLYNNGRLLLNYIRTVWILMALYLLYIQYWLLFALVLIAIWAILTWSPGRTGLRFLVRPYLYLNFIVTASAVHALSWGYSMDFRGASRILAQTGVHSVFNVKDTFPGSYGAEFRHDRVNRAVPNIASFCSEACVKDEFWIGMFWRSDFLIKINRKSESFRQYLDRRYDILDIARICSAGQILVAVRSTEGDYLVLQLAVDGDDVALVSERTILRSRRSAESSDFGTVHLELDERSHTAYVTVDGLCLTVVLDVAPTSLSMRGTLDGCRTVLGNGSVFLLRADNQVARVSARDTIYRKYPRGFSPKFTEATFDTTRNRIYISEFSGGVGIIDGDTLASVGLMKTKRGARFIHYNAKHDLLFLSNYIQGYLDVIDPDTMTIVRRLDFGYRGRKIKESADGDALTLVNAAGAFVLRIPEIFQRTRDVSSLGPLPARGIAYCR